MNKEFLNECLDVIEQIKLGSIIEITIDNEKSKYRLDYIKEHEGYELTDLDEDDSVWDDGDTIEEIKEDLMWWVIKGRFQKIRLI